MASTYSSTLNLELQATGENSGTWGTIVNNNLQKLESAAKGYVSVAIASTSDSLSATDGSTTDEQSNAIIKLTGTLTGNTTMSCEAVESWYIVDNAATMGTYTLNFKPSGGTAAYNLADSIFIGPSQAWFGRLPNVTVANIHAISSDVGDAGDATANAIVAALIDDVA